MIRDAVATSVPKIPINENKFIFKLQSAFFGNFETVTVSECCLIKLHLFILYDKYVYILGLEMASPGSQHCANCIGTLSFPVTWFVVVCSLNGLCPLLVSSLHDEAVLRNVQLGIRELTAVISLTVLTCYHYIHLYK